MVNISKNNLLQTRPFHLIQPIFFFILILITIIGLLAFTNLLYKTIQLFIIIFNKLFHLFLFHLQIILNILQNLHNFYNKDNLFRPLKHPIFQILTRLSILYSQIKLILQRSMHRMLNLFHPNINPVIPLHNPNK